MKRPEQQLQISVVQFIERALPGMLFFHVPNGGGRSKAEAGILKAMGVKAGIPDLVLLLPTSKVAFIELKASRGSLSPAQREMRDELTRRGFLWAEAKSLEQVEDILTEWLRPYGWSLNASVKARAA
jgi:hypothetical protein